MIILLLRCRIEKLEAGEGDEWEFIEWQARMRRIDREKEREEFERRRLAGLLSQESSIVSRQKLIQEKKEHAADMKAEVAFSLETSRCFFIMSVTTEYRNLLHLLYAEFFNFYMYSLYLCTSKYTLACRTS